MMSYAVGYLLLTYLAGIFCVFHDAEQIVDEFRTADGEPDFWITIFMLAGLILISPVLIPCVLGVYSYEIIFKGN
jgi:hypothetical protein